MTRHDYRSSDGVALVYDETGPADGAVLVLCHGLAAQAAQFAADADYFAGLGYRVLAPDVRGHGRSGSPVPLAAAGFSIERLAADMIEMLDHAGAERVHWVGNSLGGIVALRLLASGRLKTLATFGTSYRIALPRIGGHHLVTAGHAVLGRTAIAALTARMTSRDPAARALIERMLLEARPEVTAMLAGVLTQYDLIAEAVASEVPILMLRGGRDGLVNAGLGPTLAAMRGRPNFRLVELPEGGHCANLDATAGFRAALVEFWGQ